MNKKTDKKNDEPRHQRNKLSQNLTQTLHLTKYLGNIRSGKIRFLKRNVLLQHQTKHTIGRIT